MDKFLIVCSECGVVFDPSKRPEKQSKNPWEGVKHKCPVCGRWVDHSMGKDFHHENYD